MAPLLVIDGLSVRFDTPDGTVEAVDDVHLAIAKGESGSGKTQLFLAVMGLLAANGSVAGQARFDGTELIGLDRAGLNRIRGVRMAMIFQDPMTSLNPYLTIERQMTEVLVEHRHLSRAQARGRATDMLDLVGIPEAAQRITMYPHEFSGGMRQRVMIAMSLLCEPDLLIADEPTTALDVTVQAQILELLARLKADLGMAMALITHDLGVVAGTCDRVMVMYAGRMVETAAIETLFADPRHPYTQGLLRSLPRLDGQRLSILATIDGQPPNLQALPKGCAFADRCASAFERCRTERPRLRQLAAGRAMACHLEHRA